MALATLLVGNNTYQIGADGIVSPNPAEEDLLAFCRMQDVVDLEAPVKAHGAEVKTKTKKNQTKLTTRRKAQKKKR